MAGSHHPVRPHHMEEIGRGGGLLGLVVVDGGGLSVARSGWSVVVAHRKPMSPRAIAAMAAVLRLRCSVR